SLRARARHGRHPLPPYRSRDFLGRALRRRQLVFGSVRRALVRVGLYRRPHHRLALLPGAGQEAAAGGARAGHRRLPRLGDARRRARRPHRLHPVLQFRPVRGTSHRDALSLARRHVVPWRRGRRLHRHRAVLPAAPHPDGRLRRHHRLRRADRPLLRPHRQFHQWRAVGPYQRCRLGDDLSHRRGECGCGAAGAARALPARALCRRQHGPQLSAPSEPALRMLPRGRRAVHLAVGLAALHAGAAAAGHAERRLPHGLRHRPHHRRVLPPARCTAGLPVLGRHHGPAPVGAPAARGIVDGAARSAGAGEGVSALEALLAQRIRDAGPLGIDEYMATALTHPEHGYYTTRDPLGAAGDFVTAPEVSQMFGELVGAWCIDNWARMGRPDPVILAELGPGRGTLMADLLRAARVAPDFRRALRLHLVETSRALRAAQARRLADAAPRWHDNLDTLPQGPLLLVANEFLDALPIRQLVRKADGWHERRVTLDSDGALAFTLAAAPDPGTAIPRALSNAAPGNLCEIRPAAAALAASVGARLSRQGGVALFIDYGH